MIVVMSPLKQWSSVLNRLESILSPATVKTWFHKTEAQSENNLVEIAFPNIFALQRTNNHYLQILKEALEKELNRQDLLLKLSLKIAGGGPLGPLFSPNAPDTSPAPDLNQNDSKVEERAALSEKAEEKTWRPEPSLKTLAFGLSPFYTLDGFVVGPNNQLAYTVALSVAQNPGKAYNPFFIYAGTGLGKTHLMQAIGNEVVRLFPQSKVVYSTGEAFTNELLEAIQRRTQKKFREKFRQTDVLLIDDVQFVAGKEVTQEEFFHAFNDLYLSQKQVVLTSDRPPREIALLEERLRSRFSGGMIADIAAPDETMRTAILRTKRDRVGVDVSNEVIDFIAGEVKTNIREMEGIFLQLISVAKSRDALPDLKLASEILAQNKLLTGKEKPGPKKILEEVCSFFNLTQKELISKRRTKELVFPRQISMYLLRTLTEMTLTEIATLLGNRDHTTVLHGLEKIGKLIKENEETSQKINFLTVKVCG